MRRCNQSVPIRISSPLSPSPNPSSPCPSIFTLHSHNSIFRLPEQPQIINQPPQFLNLRNRALQFLKKSRVPSNPETLYCYKRVCFKIKKSTPPPPASRKIAVSQPALSLYKYTIRINTICGPSRTKKIHVSNIIPRTRTESMIIHGSLRLRTLGPTWTLNNLPFRVPFFLKSLYKSLNR